MKGRFRKGKKAYRSGTNNRIKLQGRYQRWLVLRDQRRQAAVAMIQAGIVCAMGAAQMAAIQSVPIHIAEDRQARLAEKALAMVSVAIGTAQAMVRAMTMQPAVNHGPLTIVNEVSREYVQCPDIKPLPPEAYECGNNLNVPPLTAERIANNRYMRRHFNRPQTKL